MNLIAIMPARNEAWCLGITLRAALQWCDSIVVLDHASTDETPTIIKQVSDEFSGRIDCILEMDPLWEEMRHRQRMLARARHNGATHIALIDADEILTANGIPLIRDYVDRLFPHAVLQLPWHCITGGGNYISSGMWNEQFVSVAFPDDPTFHWAARNGYDFHHRHPMGAPIKPVKTGRFGLMHLQFASKRRLLAKQYLYQLTERQRWPHREKAEVMSAKYVRTVTEATSAQTKPCPLEWWEGYEDLLQYLHVDAEPWQEAECRKMLAENLGIGEGLNDFGLF